MSISSIAQEEELAKFNNFKVEAVEGQTYIPQQWINLVKWQDYENQSWEWVEDITKCK